MDWYAFSGERPLGRSAVNLWRATGLDYLVPPHILLRILLDLILANRVSFKHIGPSPRTFSATGLDRETAMRFASQETTDNRDIQRFNVTAPCIMCTEINTSMSMQILPFDQTLFPGCFVGTTFDPALFLRCPVGTTLDQACDVPRR